MTYWHSQLWLYRKRSKSTFRIYKFQIQLVLESWRSFLSQQSYLRSSKWWASFWVSSHASWWSTSWSLQHCKNSRVTITQLLVSSHVFICKSICWQLRCMFSCQSSPTSKERRTCIFTYSIESLEISFLWFYYKFTIFT